MFTKQFTVRQNADISPIIAYQNTQLIQLICKEKGWDVKNL